MKSLLRRFVKDSRQRLRIRRLSMAAATYAVAALLAVVFTWRGMLAPEHLPLVLALPILINLVLFWVFLSGHNLRYRDPSLTLPQIAAACLSMLPALYLAEGGRGALLIIYLTILLFGVLRLGIAQFLVLAAVMVLSYGGVLIAILLIEPGRFDLDLEFAQWLAFTLLMPAFALLSGYVSRIRDQLRVSNHELQAAMSRIQELAIRDELTGVYNRRHLMELLAQEKERSARGREPFCVCLFDIDHFKAINDGYGHLAGDAVLRKIAAAALEGLRGVDVFGRYGGEEFVAVLVRTAAADARSCAERLRVRVARCRFPELSEELNVTVSIGVAEHLPGEDYLQTLGRADQALYRAKENGRNRVEPR